MVLFHTSPYCARYDRACGIRHDRLLDAYEDSGAPSVAGPPFCSTTCDGRALFAACFSCKVRWEDLQVAVGNPQCGAFSPAVAKGERLDLWSLWLSDHLWKAAPLYHIFHFEYAHQRRPKSPSLVGGTTDSKLLLSKLFYELSQGVSRKPACQVFAPVGLQTLGRSVFV